MGKKYPIISGGEGSIEVGSDSISHSELFLKVTINGINDGNEIPVNVLFSQPAIIITTGAARGHFEGVSGDADYECSGLTGHGAWLYSDHVPDGGWFDGVKFVEIDISGRILKHSTDETFNIAIMANDRDNIDPPHSLRVKKGMAFKD